MIRHLPRALASIASDVLRAKGGSVLAPLIALSLVFAVLTVAAPQMTPMQTERAFQQVYGKLATLEDLIRKVERSNEIHQEAARSHPHYGSQIEAQALVLQAHSLRLAELDAVVRFVAWCVAIGVALLAIIASVALTIRKGHKKIADEHHEICEILQRMDERATGRRVPS